MCKSGIIQLSTWHTKDFSLSSGHIDWEKSSYYMEKDLPKLRPCYDIIANIIGTNQLIWCFSDRSQAYWYRGYPRVEWVLSVPRSKILTYYDECAWHRLIGCNDVIFQQWRADALKAFPASSAHRDKYINKKQQEYDLPDDILWKRLIVDANYDGIWGVILKHPINPHWIHMNVPRNRKDWPTPLVVK